MCRDGIYIFCPQIGSGHVLGLVMKPGQGVPDVVTLVSGAATAMSSPKPRCRRMVDVSPRRKLVTVPDIGHAPTLVEPVVLAALGRLLGGLRAL
jgi:hypothetical protein